MMKVLIGLLLLIFTTAQEWEGFTSSCNLFASSLYKEILKENTDNFIISPFSAELVLALVQVGARNETATELQQILHLPQDQEKIKASIKTLMSSLIQNDGYSFHVANKVYVKDSCHLKEQFMRVATEVFSAEVESLDFSQTISAAKKINQWVEEHTNNKIHELIDPDVLSRNTRAVLINALYFQGNWTYPFGTRHTKVKDFHKDLNTVLRVPMMHLRNGLFNYYENTKLKAKFLEMPFRNLDASMMFVVPDEINGLSSLEEHIEQVLQPQKFRESFIHVSLPKFKVESKFDFTQVLKNLGVVSAFDEDKANFSGISDDKLHISKVAQKSFIDVNEGGVEAAAASYDVISPRIYALLHIDVDRPFIFYIKVKNVITFVGRVTTPSYAE